MTIGDEINSLELAHASPVSGQTNLSPESGI